MNWSLRTRFIALFTTIWVDDMQISYQLTSWQIVAQLLWIGGQAIDF